MTTEVIQVIEAHYAGGHRVSLRFNDELCETIDLSTYLNYGPIFLPLSDPEYFKRFTLQHGTITWPNGADIAPEKLHEIALQINSQKKQNIP